MASHIETAKLLDGASIETVQAFRKLAFVLAYQDDPSLPLETIMRKAEAIEKVAGR
jgi:hypothetical protein